MKKFTITVTGSSTKTYHSQLVEIASALDEIEVEVDGYVSGGRQNIRVFWQGGKADDLKNATNVTILDENRGFAFQGELSSTVNPPREVEDGVEFFLERFTN